MVKPYLPSLEWYRSGAVPRRLNRTGLRGGQLLTVPICGGISVVKHADPASWIISDHGDWRRIHWGAIESTYSRTPFFSHYAPRLHEIIFATHPCFADLSEALDAEIRRCLGIDTVLPLLSSPTPLIRGYAAQLWADADPQLSVMDPLMRLGPDAIFLLFLR